MQTKSRPITIYCSDELYAWVQRWAAQDDRSMSAWIGRKLDQARLKSTPQPQPQPQPQSEASPP